MNTREEIQKANERVLEARDPAEVAANVRAAFHVLTEDVIEAVFDKLAVDKLPPRYPEKLLAAIDDLAPYIPERLYDRLPGASVGYYGLRPLLYTQPDELVARKVAATRDPDLIARYTASRRCADQAYQAAIATCDGSLLNAVIMGSPRYRLDELMRLAFSNADLRRMLIPMLTWSTYRAADSKLFVELIHTYPTEFASPLACEFLLRDHYHYRVLSHVLQLVATDANLWKAAMRDNWFRFLWQGKLYCQLPSRVRLHIAVLVRRERGIVPDMQRLLTDEFLTPDELQLLRQYRLCDLLEKYV